MSLLAAYARTGELMREHEELERSFAAIRRELGVRAGFPAEVEGAAEAAAAGEWKAVGHEDLEGVPFVTIDPPGSRDLDQALFLESVGGGYRLLYAIADVACFVERGGVVEREAWLRGVTYYSPDRRDPLYPEAISQGAASLLPQQLRPAIVFDLELDESGELRRSSVRRARVRSRAQLTYQQALAHITGDDDAYRAEPFAASLALLRTVGELRQAREQARGGVSLPIPAQHVERRAAIRVGYHLGYEEPNAAEGWNAQVSLLTGHVAAERMIAARVGLLRTMPPPDPKDVEQLRRAARALGAEWPAERSYAELIRSLDPADPRSATLVWQARYLMRGADYVAMDGEIPEHPRHAALAMTYAHCTAPLRRLADRYVLDLLVQLQAGEHPSTAERETLRGLPEVMNAADRRSGQLERRIVDTMEAWLLRDRVGETLPAVVLATSREWVEVQLSQSPIRARAQRGGGGAPPPGESVGVRVEGVEEGEIRLALVELS